MSDEFTPQQEDAVRELWAARADFERLDQEWVAGEISMAAGAAHTRDWLVARSRYKSAKAKAEQAFAPLMP